MKSVMFDVDGVLADFVLGFTTLAAELGSNTTPYSCIEQRRWDFDLPRGLVCRVWEKIHAADSLFWETLPALVSGEELERIRKLSVDEHVYFVTARDPGPTKRPKAQTEAWLTRRGITNPAVIVCANKGNFARAVEIDFAIDDKAGNAVYIAYDSPGTRSFLLNRPSNLFDETVLGSRVERVMSVTDFLTAVEEGA